MVLYVDAVVAVTGWRDANSRFLGLGLWGKHDHQIKRH